MRKCANAQMCKWANAHMCQCADVQMRQCANAQMCKRANAQIRPRLGQTRCDRAKDKTIWADKRYGVRWEIKQYEKPRQYETIWRYDNMRRQKKWGKTRDKTIRTYKRHGARGETRQYETTREMGQNERQDNKNIQETWAGVSRDTLQYEVTIYRDKDRGKVKKINMIVWLIKGRSCNGQTDRWTDGLKIRRVESRWPHGQRCADVANRYRPRH